MLDTLTAGTWGTALKSPLPNNATTTAGAQDASLRGVACLTASECTYVGFYADTNGNGEPFALASSATGNKTDPAFAGWTFHPKTAARSVTATYKAPRLKCTSTTAGVSPGVAMATGTPKTEKFSAATLLSYCSHGVSHEVADAEVDGKQVGAPPTDKVYPSDVLKATVTTSATTTTATIADNTNGHRFTWTKSGNGGTAFEEWVLADSTAFGPIADFGSISFTAGAVGGKALGSVSPAGTPYNMQTSKGILQVVTGPLTSTTKNAFTTTWKHL
jgi:hypothetical protein